VAKLPPEVHTAVAAAIRDAVPDLDFLRLGGPAYARSPANSVDYAVMEQTRRAAVLPVSYQWSDVGNWDAVSALNPADADGNAIPGDGLVVGGHGNLFYSGGRLVMLLGLDNVVFVTTNDSTLVASRTRSEEVKALVSRLEAEGLRQAREALQMFRPWGNYEQLDVGLRIPSQAHGGQPWRDSPQRHKHRSEHWAVVSGEVNVTVGDRISRVLPNGTLFIPAGTNHRLANSGTAPAVLIEVLTGSYLGEDDVICLEDVYNRLALETEALDDVP